MDQEPHVVQVPRIADSLVIQIPDAALIGLTHRPNAARGIERLIRDPVENDLLTPFKRQCLDRLASVERVGEFDVIVDQPRRGPGEIVLHLIVGREWQCTNPQFKRLHLVQGSNERGSDDVDWPWGQPALWDEDKLLLVYGKAPHERG